MPTPAELMAMMQQQQNAGQNPNQGIAQPPPMTPAPPQIRPAKPARSKVAPPRFTAKKRHPARGGG